MEPFVAVLALVALIALMALVWLIANYNRFARLGQHLRESWADIDVELKRRHDLIPNLVETVRGYAAHERETLEQVVALRNKAATSHDRISSRETDEVELEAALRRLFALVESYPVLKADAHFMALQEELALTEDRLAAARRFYNANVRELNQLCATFPTNFIAATFGFEPADFFELESPQERRAPQVGY